MIGMAVGGALLASCCCLWLWLRERRRVAVLREGLLDAVHEISRPLTALRMAFTAPRFADHCLGLDAEVERAAASLADLSRIAGVAAPFRRERFDLGQVVQQIADVWQASAAAAGRTLTAEVIGTSAVLGDRGRVGQAVENLVANALEHGSGEVRVAVTEAAGRCVVEVVDGGGGSGVGRPVSGDAVLTVRRGRGLRIASQIALAGGGVVDRGHVSDGRVRLELPAAGAVV